MEFSIRSPLKTLVVLIFTLTIAFSASVVESQTTKKQLPAPKSLPPHVKPPPPLSPIHKSSATAPSSPPSPPPHGRWPSPRGAGAASSPLQPSQPLKYHPPSLQPPPRNRKFPPSAGNVAQTKKSKGLRLNLGKKVGLFSGIAVILQIGVVGFLVYKKKQLYRVRD